MRTAVIIVASFFALCIFIGIVGPLLPDPPPDVHNDVKNAQDAKEEYRSYWPPKRERYVLAPEDIKRSNEMLRRMLVDLTTGKVKTYEDTFSGREVESSVHEFGTRDDVTFIDPYTFTDGNTGADSWLDVGK